MERTLVSRTIELLISGTWLAEYKEVYSDGTIEYCTMSYLWDGGPEDLCR